MSIDSKIVRMTPARAEGLLSENRRNRPIREALVRQYAREMIAGRWQVNGESVKVSESGALLDGQHRLRAIVKSQKAVDLVLVTGLPDESFHTIDTGMRRSSSQIIALTGQANATILAAAARCIALMEGSGSTSVSITPQETLDIIEAHPLIHKYATAYSNKSLRALLPAGTCGVFVLAAEKFGETIADDFLARFSAGEGLTKSDPVYELRERMIAARSRIAKLPSPVVIAITIKAVRAYATGRTLGLLRWSQAEEWPSL